MKKAMFRTAETPLAVFRAAHIEHFPHTYRLPQALVAKKRGKSRTRRALTQAAIKRSWHERVTSLTNAWHQALKRYDLSLAGNTGGNPEEVYRFQRYLFSQLALATEHELTQPAVTPFLDHALQLVQAVREWCRQNVSPKEYVQQAEQADERAEYVLWWRRALNKRSQQKRLDRRAVAHKPSRRQPVVSSVSPPIKTSVYPVGSGAPVSRLPLIYYQGKSLLSLSEYFDCPVNFQEDGAVQAMPLKVISLSRQNHRTKPPIKGKAYTMPSAARDFQPRERKRLADKGLRFADLSPPFAAAA